MRIYAIFTLAAAVFAKIPGAISGDEDDVSDGMDSMAAATTKPCLYTSPAGAKYDLRGMRRSDHDFLGTTPGGYTYRFNVCAGSVKVCNRQAAPASKWRGSKCNNLGDIQTQEFSQLDPVDPSKGIKVTYKDGDICKKQVNGQMEIGSREVTYEIQCDYGQDPGMLKHIQEVSMCEYTISFMSRYGCPVSGQSGSHGWSIIFWIMFGTAAYLAIGIGINRYKYGLQGMETIPNHAFWLTVPGLVKDGVALTTEKAKLGYEYAHQKYQQRAAAVV